MDPTKVLEGGQAPPAPTSWAHDKRRTFSAPESTRVRFGRSGSFKVDDFGTSRKRVYMRTRVPISLSL